ncbi:hypothetical protein A3A39_04980 [Candidatus Kaiserbacteria bacterium RIFCSPLOWO2_01_FULL_54_13]|uniref:Uncharacterized protein n=1 Tax=Candidatus Kaiserbacteria bacterium RIFCSPLOWO2_01_FULL_54_13 TaxID=1798512 RepID=A0A1F6F012_9BACT|nr:MAG: hypothetical protein A3A39_04980 [Candidatus Kaiserbacteria bacterium RIFCSPLOWO2_01_FULL_54_13]
MENAPVMLGLVLWVLLAAASLLSLTLGVALAYHWFNYSTNATAPFVATVVYSGVSLVLLTSLFALALSI